MAGRSTSFWVEGVRGQARPRFTKNGHIYTKDEDTRYREAVAESYLAAGGEYLGESPVLVSVDVYRPLPKSTPKKVLSDHQIQKPDADNIGKIVCDSLNKVAYADDKQVIQLIVSKRDRTRETEEAIHVHVTEYGGEDD